MSSHRNRLIEAILLSTHNIPFSIYIYGPNSFKLLSIDIPFSPTGQNISLSVSV